jgi:hypothetical protein
MRPNKVLTYPNYQQYKGMSVYRQLSNEEGIMTGCRAAEHSALEGAPRPSLSRYIPYLFGEVTFSSFCFTLSVKSEN